MNRFLMKLIGGLYAAPEGGGGTGGGTGAGTGDGGQPGGATAAGGGAPGAAAGGGAAPDWYHEFKDPDVKTWLGSFKGAYPNAEAVALKAYNLEKFVGAEKSGRGVIAPKPDAPAEEWVAFNKKLGVVPEKADAYALPKDFDPEAAKALQADPMLGKFQQFAHQIGLSKGQFGAVMKWFADESKGRLDAAEGDFLKKAEGETEALKKEWGSDYDKNVELGRRAAQAFIKPLEGESIEDVIGKIEDGLGTARTLQLFKTIGEGMSEHSFISDSGADTGGGSVTPEGARLKIADLKKDKEWVASFMKGDVEKKAEWDRLHKIGYGSTEGT